MIEGLTDEERDAIVASWGRRAVDQQAKALAAAEARIAAATEILLGSSGHLASEVLAALRGER